MEIFSTTGESLLAHKLAAAKRNERYKPSDRSELRSQKVEGGMTMSSLVQRQSERQGIFLIVLSPFKRGAGGVKYQPYLSPPHTPYLLSFPA